MENMIRLFKSMRIYLNISPFKFYADPIWNYAASLSLFEYIRPNNKENKKKKKDKMSCDVWG